MGGKIGRGGNGKMDGLGAASSLGADENDGSGLSSFFSDFGASHLGVMPPVFLCIKSTRVLILTIAATGLPSWVTTKRSPWSSVVAT